MNRENWQQLKAVLDEALERDGADREFVVGRFCARNPEMAGELRSLLRSVDETRGPTDSSTIGFHLAARQVLGGSADLPEQIGPYRIVSKLGEGGMGVVYEAEQANPKRRVAVKIVRGGQFVDEHHARLFQREADTLARLKHPGIGSIFESGRTEHGQHFFAMELVQGEPLDVYVGRRPKVVGEVELRFRLSLFRKIADAVHYAHQRGVIHRDLKPSNIFVTDEVAREDDTTAGATRPGQRLPEVKILDFGLARITDGDVAAATMTTEVGLIKGTLPYMSPEQARGDPEQIDLRADVYALGVILYEMLSGHRPYDVTKKSLAEAVRIICEQPPTTLRQFWSGARRIDPDLETIVGRALEKDAGRRYSSAAALSEDVARYLTSQPILARPPSAVYQLRKFARRNRTLVGGIVATFVVLLAGVVVSVSLGLREARQRRGAEAARSDLQQVVNFQSGMLREVDPQQMGLALLEDIKRRVVDAAREQNQPQGAIELELAALTGSLGRINSTDAALRVIDEEFLGRAAESIGERFGDQPLIEATLRLSLGETYRALGLLDRAETQLLQAKAIRDRELGPEHEESLLAALLLSWNYERQARFSESEQAAGDAYQIATRVLGKEHNVTLWLMNRLAIAYDQLSRYGESLPMYRELYDARRTQVGDDHTETHWIQHNIGTVYRNTGRPDEGAPWLEQSLEGFRNTRGEDHRDTQWARFSLALAYQALGRLDEAEQLILTSLESLSRDLGDDHDETLRSRTCLASIYKDQGRLVEAEVILHDTLARKRQLLGEDHMQTRYALEVLAMTLDKLGRSDEAAARYEELVTSWDRTSAPENRWTVEAKLQLCRLYRELDRPDEAEALLWRTLQADLAEPDRTPEQLARTHAELASLAAEVRKH